MLLPSSHMAVLSNDVWYQVHAYCPAPWAGALLCTCRRLWRLLRLRRIRRSTLARVPWPSDTLGDCIEELDLTVDQSPGDLRHLDALAAHTPRLCVLNVGLDDDTLNHLPSIARLVRLLRGAPTLRDVALDITVRAVDVGNVRNLVSALPTSVATLRLGVSTLTRPRPVDVGMPLIGHVLDYLPPKLRTLQLHALEASQARTIFVLRQLGVFLGRCTTLRPAPRLRVGRRRAGCRVCISLPPTPTVCPRRCVSTSRTNGWQPVPVCVP